MRRWRNVLLAVGGLCVFLVTWSRAVWLLGLVLLALSGVGHLLHHRARRRAQAGAEPVDVAVPVTGRWRALNSPAVRTPSHGTHTCAQTFAVDVVHEPEDPEDAERPGFAWRPLTRRPEEFPAFGAPVLAPGDGVVVRVSDGARDHLSRTSWPALAYLLAEGFVRQLFGARHLLGNHVVLDLGGGTFALLAHLRRGSLTVAPGDRVSVGEPLARCGNSGNSSEPHVHFQLMTGPDHRHAHGLPFSWRYRADDADHTGVPPDNTLFTASEATRP
ncbi:M23 family metallopeptidase [Streptomyces chumphonensis]|uniref:M23 family metallopeptidase n=1 Tax=Streptomyces chumphonensis TaxID=1214925 RepID=UPI003D75A383